MTLPWVGLSVMKMKNLFKIAFDNMNLVTIIMLILPIFPTNMDQYINQNENTNQEQESHIQLRDR